MDPEKKPELNNTLSLSEGEIGHTTTEHLPIPNAAVIQDAIEAIGMGRYQWQLMISCGFGFVVDQVRVDDIPKMRRFNIYLDASVFHRSRYASSIQRI